MTEPRAPLKRRTYFLLRQNLALAGALGLFATTLLHVLLVSDLNVATAQTILRVADRTQIVAGASLSLAVATLPFALRPSLLSWCVDGLRSGRSIARQLQSIFLISLFGFVVLRLLTTLILLVLLVVIVVARVEIGRRRRSGQGDRVAPDGLRLVASDDAYETFTQLALISGVALLFSSLSVPWVPIERVGLSSESVSVYVIGAEEERSLLLSREGDVSWIDSSAIQSRRLCYNNRAWWRRTLIDYLDPPNYLPCSPDGRPVKTPSPREPKRSIAS